MLSEVKGHCCVLFIRDYVKSCPVGVADDDVFVCESRYAYKAKSFKKIKHWSYPPGRQPRLIARDLPITLKKVPSVFVTQSTRVKGSGSNSMVPASDMMKLEEAELYSEGQGVELSLPYPEEVGNVKAEGVANPAQDSAYYEQYCIDEDRFRLGM